MSDLICDVTEDTFKDEVLLSKQPVLLDFWAPWCGPCKMITPVLERIAEDFKGRVKVVKVNIDENMNITNEYGVLSIPTLILFKEGRPNKARQNGMVTHEKLTAFLEEQLAE